MDTIKRIKDLAHLHRSYPTVLVEELQTMLDERPNPLKEDEREIVTYALRKAREVQKRRHYVEVQLLGARAARDKPHKSSKLVSLETALEALLARYEAEERALRESYEESAQDAAQAKHRASVRVLQLEARRDAIEIVPEDLFDQRYFWKKKKVKEANTSEENE